MTTTPKPPGVRAREAVQEQAAPPERPRVKDGEDAPTLARTNDLGQFVTANQNPFPVPSDFRNGPSGAKKK
jgi:hypothetical protein